MIQEWLRQTKPKQVRFENFPGRSEELVPEPPFARKYYTTPPQKGGSGTNSGLLSGNCSNLTFFGLFCRSHSGHDNVARKGVPEGYRWSLLQQPVLATKAAERPFAPAHRGAAQSDHQDQTFALPTFPCTPCPSQLRHIDDPFIIV